MTDQGIGRVIIISLYIFNIRDIFLLLEEYVPNIKYVKGNNNDTANALISHLLLISNVIES